MRFESLLKRKNRNVGEPGTPLALGARELTGSNPVIPTMNNEELEILAREHFPEDTGIHIAMREVWIERYINNTNNNNTMTTTQQVQQQQINQTD